MGDVKNMNELWRRNATRIQNPEYDKILRRLTEFDPKNFADVCLTEKEIYVILDGVLDACQHSKAALIDIEAPMFICGDIHGNYPDMIYQQRSLRVINDYPISHISHMKLSEPLPPWKRFSYQCRVEFFGIIHGKSVCDGIGGTASRACLKRATEGQILSHLDLFKFCPENISGINFIYISKDEVELHQSEQELRSLNGKTVARPANITILNQLMKMGSVISKSGHFCMIISDMPPCDCRVQDLLYSINLKGFVVPVKYGQFADLKRLFDYCGWPPEKRFLFLGDYVDRGPFSIETVCLIFILRLMYPKDFYILRGNHESDTINRVYGFYEENKRRYGNVCGRKLYAKFQKIFDSLPICGLINKRIFCMHGGLSPEFISFDQLRSLSLPFPIPKETSLVSDLLWSDPEPGIQGFLKNSRGIGHLFGEDVVKNFCQKYGIDLIVRAHQVFPQGYEFFAGRKLITVFSAPNYCGQFHNAAGMVYIDVNLRCSVMVRVQSLPFKSLTQCIVRTYRRESIAGFYKGMLFPCLSAGFLHSMYFGGSSLVIKHLNGRNESLPDSHVPYSHIIAGSIFGGFLQWIPSCPIEVVKIKLQVQTGHENFYKNPLDCLLKVWRSRRFNGLYAGGSSLLLRDLIAVAFYLPVYELLLRNLPPRQQDFGSQITNVALAGGVAGVASWLAILPLDVVKSRLQADNLASPTYTSSWDCVRKSYKEEGLRTFYRGWSMVALRAFPVNAVIFIVYEKFKAHFCFEIK